MAQKSPQKIVGVFESVSFPSFGMENVIAKIDTGAYTGALHCTKIEEEVQKSGKVLHFSPFDIPDKTISTSDFVMGPVKSSNGKRERRYFITTNIVIDNETYVIKLSLANRSQMRRSVLIGRRFLRHNHFVVDASKTAQYGKRVQGN